MPSMGIYSLTVPNDAQTNSRGEGQRNVATAGILDGETAQTEPISVGAQERVLQGQYRLKYSDLMATELVELFNSDTIEQVPFYGIDEPTPEDGYYTLRSMTAKPIDPRGRIVHDFDGQMVQVGTRATHWRATATTPYQVENDFGNDQTALIGIPAVATKVRWFNPETQETEAPTLVETRSAEFGDVDMYDAKAASFTAPTMLMALPYAEDGKVDVTVWDDYGREKHDADGHLQWAHVFSTSHEYTGAAILDTGLLRLTFDETNQSLTAEQWDDTNSTWSALSLGMSDWVLFDLDLYEIGGDRVVGQTVFENTIDGSQFHLDVLVNRGYATAQWVVPANESGPVPSGLVDKLTPVADTQDFNAQQSQAVVERKEVRK